MSFSLREVREVMYGEKRLWNIGFRSLRWVSIEECFKSNWLAEENKRGMRNLRWKLARMAAQLFFSFGKKVEATIVRC